MWRRRAGSWALGVDGGDGVEFQLFEFVFQRRQLTDRVPEVLGGLSCVVLRRFCHPPPFPVFRDGFGVVLHDVLPDVGAEAAKRDHEGLFRGMSSFSATCWVEVRRSSVVWDVVAAFSTDRQHASSHPWRWGHSGR